MNSVVLISAVQQSDSGIHIYTHTPILFHILIHYGLSQHVDYRSYAMQ